MIDPDYSLHAAFAQGMQSSRDRPCSHSPPALKIALMNQKWEATSLECGRRRSIMSGPDIISAT
jgi:hypothetical protein